MFYYNNSFNKIANINLLNISDFVRWYGRHVDSFTRRYWLTGVWLKKIIMCVVYTAEYAMNYTVYKVHLGL